MFRNISEITSFLIDNIFWISEQLPDVLIIEKTSFVSYFCSLSNTSHSNVFSLSTFSVSVCQKSQLKKGSELKGKKSDKQQPHVHNILRSKKKVKKRFTPTVVFRHRRNNRIHRIFSFFTKDFYFYHFLILLFLLFFSASRINISIIEASWFLRCRHNHRFASCISSVTNNSDNTLSNFQLSWNCAIHIFKIKIQFFKPLQFSSSFKSKSQQPEKVFGSLDF